MIFDYLTTADWGSFLFDYDKIKDILIQEIERIEIVCDKDCGTIESESKNLTT